MKRVGLLLVMLGSLGWCYQGLLCLEPHGDFRNHREWGRRLLAGEFLYHGGANTPYLPYWALVHVPLAMLPEGSAFSCHIFAGLAALGSLLFLSIKAAVRAFSIRTESASWLTGIVLMLASRPIMRDLQDGGANLIVVALTWAAMTAWLAEHRGKSVFLVGQAIALKSTALLFVGYLCWQRQWRQAMASIVAASVFLSLPMVVQGPAWFRAHLTVWWAHMHKGMTSSDPRVGILGTEEVRNLALRPTLGRILITQFGSKADVLSQMNRILSLSALLLVAAVFGSFVTQDADGLRARTRQCAVLLLLALLVSPITWLPHSVAAIPALAFIGAAILSGQERRPLFILIMVGSVVLLRGPVNPGLFGRRASDWLQVHGATTWAILSVLILTLCAGGQRASADDGLLPLATRIEAHPTRAYFDL